MEGMLLLLLVVSLLFLVRAMIQIALLRYRQQAIYDFVTTFRQVLSSTPSTETDTPQTQRNEWPAIFGLLALLFFLLWLLPKTF